MGNARLCRTPPPVIEVPARQFPVTIHFNRKTELDDYVSAAFRKTCAIHRRLPPGGVLVFVTGQAEVEQLCQRLKRTFPAAGGGKAAGPGGAGAAQPGKVKVKRRKDGDRDEGEEDEEGGAEAGASAGGAAGGGWGPSGADDGGAEAGPSCDVFDRDAADAAGEDEAPGTSGGGAAGAEWAGVRTKGGGKGGRKGRRGGDDDLADDFSEGESDSEESETMLLDGDVGDEEISKAVDADAAAAAASEAAAAVPGGAGADGGEQSGPGPVIVLPLYAMLPPKLQARVFQAVPPGVRLIVVATNVAETSLTIPGIRYVVDTGRAKERIFEGRSGLSRFEVSWVSKASAEQRAGRAGRTGPGHCYRIYSSAHFSNSFAPHAPPDILGVPIEGVVLQMKAMGIDKVHFDTYQTPL